MENFDLDREIARLILLQRIELLTPHQRKIRKLFGRYFFTNFFSKFFINPKEIGKKYLLEMVNEYNLLAKYINFENKKILSIGSGMCGLELIISSKSSGNSFSIIEKNYISKKIKYGWDQNNIEAYNNIAKLKIFLSNNGMMKSRYNIYDFDRDNLPSDKFDCIISLYSLDYHYDFKLYEDYFQRTFHQNSILIFDTIRPDYFLKLFDDVKIIASTQKNIHSSKRILCRGYKY